MKEPVHLGDGAYATVLNEYTVMLTANHHDPKQATSVIYLGPHELAALREYLRDD